MVRVPDRADPAFGDTAKVTVPLPVPDAPDVTAIQSTFDVAVHVQANPVATVTVTVEPGPPAASIIWLVGEME